MKTFKGRIEKKMKFLIALLIATPVIVLFQNCGPSAFRTQNYQKLQESKELSSGSSIDQFPNGNLPETVDDPQNEIFPPDPSKVSTTSSTGKVYFVSTSGNNNNPGSVSKPFKSIAYAVSKMVAGDTTYTAAHKFGDIVSMKRLKISSN